MSVSQAISVQTAPPVNWEASGIKQVSSARIASMSWARVAPQPVLVLQVSRIASAKTHSSGMKRVPAKIALLVGGMMIQAGRIANLVATANMSATENFPEG